MSQQVTNGKSYESEHSKNNVTNIQYSDSV